MICNAIGLTTDSFESIYTTGGTEVEEVYGAINYGELIYAKIREITGTAPLHFTSRVADHLTDYRIYGETIQDGAPSPDMPVDVVGCGVRTENLWDPSSTELERIFEIEPSTSYRVSKYPPLGLSRGRADIALYDIDMNLQYSSFAHVWEGASLTGNANTRYAKVTLSSVPASVTDPWKYIYFGKGTGNISPLPFVPYGYKLPLTVNGTEYPIYLGQVPTTRRIKKFVFDGTEGPWATWNRIIVYRAVSPSGFLTSSTAFCTHFVNGARSSDGRFGFDDFINFRNGYHTATSIAFNEYLAAQYAAGTPVTIWYVLAKPETGIVNEPLHRIGDYADTISFAQAGVTIPTVSGANVLDMTSAVKPSQMYIKGKIKPDGYGKLVDKNGVYILDKDGAQLTVHGQGTSNA